MAKLESNQVKVNKNEIGSKGWTAVYELVGMRFSLKNDPQVTDRAVQFISALAEKEISDGIDRYIFGDD